MRADVEGRLRRNTCRAAGTCWWRRLAFPAPWGGQPDQEGLGGLTLLPVPPSLVLVPAYHRATLPLL